ncbi:unnamed protein product [Closterium sp. NIES-54]
MPINPLTNTSTTTLPLLVKVGEIAAKDAEGVRPSSLAPTPPLVTDLRGLPPVSASGDEGRSGASPVAPAKSIAGGRCDAVKVGVGAKLTPTREQQAKEVQPTLVQPAKKAPTWQQPTGEETAAKPTKEQLATRQSAREPTVGEKSAGTPTTVQQDAEGSDAGDDGGDAEKSTDSDVVEVQPRPRRTGRLRRPPDFFIPAAFTKVYDKVDDDLLYDDAEDEELPELDPNMHADPEPPGTSQR